MPGLVKDIARGSATARSLAISSPTPSVESLRMVLGAASSWGVELSLHATDVSQAFMTSPFERSREDDPSLSVEFVNDER